MSSNGSYTKFGFDTEFFELVQGQKTGNVPQPSRQKQPDLDEARRQGYEEGYTAGLAEGQKQAQADLAQMQQHLQNTLMALQKAQTVRDEELLGQVLSLLRVSVHHLMGQAALRYGPELLEHHLRAVLPLLATDETLTLRIHPSARGYHEKLGLPQASIMGLPMHIKPDPALGPSDAVVEWANGGVESKLQRHLELVDALLLGAGASPLPVAPRPDLNPAPAVAGAQGEESPAPVVPEVAASEPQHASLPATEADLESAAAKAARERARALLGDDDDDLVDALK